MNRKVAAASTPPTTKMVGQGTTASPLANWFERVAMKPPALAGA
jgi:hypothetical protein